jgi:hypothetical protein
MRQFKRSNDLKFERVISGNRFKRSIKRFLSRRQVRLFLLSIQDSPATGPSHQGGEGATQVMAGESCHACLFVHPVDQIAQAVLAEGDPLPTTFMLGHKEIFFRL